MRKLIPFRCSDEISVKLTAIFVHKFQSQHRLPAPVIRFSTAASHRTASIGGLTILGERGRPAAGCCPSGQIGPDLGAQHIDRSQAAIGLHVPEGPRRMVEVNKPEVVDDVYFTKHFMTQSMSLADAVQFHRETNHPSVYNSPEALITMKVELDMQLQKKNRYLDNFSRILIMPHRFEYQPIRKVLAFCKTQETQEEAVKAGADAVGGVDLIKRIQVLLPFQFFFY